MLTPACPRLMDMINDFVLLRFWARAPRGFKRYRSYIILLLLLLLVYMTGYRILVALSTCKDIALSASISWLER